MKQTLEHTSLTSSEAQSKSQNMGISEVLPDVASESTAQTLASLPWVGMNKIEVPILWPEANGSQLRIPSLVSAQVSLDKKSSRGIHMSRLYLSVQKILASQPISSKSLRLLTDEFLNSHKELSQSARVVIDFNLPIERKALKSDFMGWRSYPVRMIAVQSKNDFNFMIEVLVTYSSTCPASAALSRQIQSQDFATAFPNSGSAEQISAWLLSAQGMPATPHAQRSEARIIAQIKSDSQFQAIDLINLIENALQTPVQAAVKREDEQEFARRNGLNLMFCEDAARKIQQAFDTQSDLVDYYGQFQHFESLHPHNAVSFIQKKAQSGLNSFINT